MTILILIVSIFSCKVLSKIHKDTQMTCEYFIGNILFVLRYIKPIIFTHIDIFRFYLFIYNYNLWKIEKRWYKLLRCGLFLRIRTSIGKSGKLARSLCCRSVCPSVKIPLSQEQGEVSSWNLCKLLRSTVPL